MTKKAFERLLIEAVDDAFSSLGNSVKQSIYFHLETKFNIPKNEIPTRVPEFEVGLETIFGPGSKFLEILIMSKLYEKTGKSLKLDKNGNLVFVDYVEAAKQGFSKSRETIAR